MITTHQVHDIADARRIIGFYRARWTIEQVVPTVKTKGFDIESPAPDAEGPLEKLVTAILIAAIKVMQFVAEREGKAKRPLADVFDPDDQPALERVCRSLEGKTEKQKNPHPKDSLAYAACVLAKLGGWTGYYGKPGPMVILRGLNRVLRHQARLDPAEICKSRRPAGEMYGRTEGGDHINSIFQKKRKKKIKNPSARRLRPCACRQRR